MPTIKIFSLPKYKIKLETVKYELINPATQSHFLRNNGGYHERIEKYSQLKINIDVEYLKKPVEDLFTEIISFFSNYNINISIDDISYTKNFGKYKDGVLQSSYHIVISKYFMVSSSMKQLWIKFSQTYGYDNEIDYGHLGSNGTWFRLPNQLKENVANTEHKIQRGKLEDFILQYIPEDCIDLNDNPIAKINVELNKKKEKLDIKRSLGETDIVRVSYNNESIKNKFNISLIENLKTPENTDIIDLLTLIPESYFDNFKEWLDIGILCFCILEYKTGYLVWNELSKRGKNYTEEGCLDKYTRFSRKEKTIGSLIFLVKKLNEKGYNNYLSKKKFLEVNGGMDTFPSLQINTRFLINLTDEKETKEQKSVKDFLQESYDNNKIICIKSDMGTGKTAMLEYYISTYNPKKILWITHRKSLTCNLLNRFKKYGFISYLDVTEDFPIHWVYQSDRLIVQLESLLLVDYYYLLEDIKKYDLILIDECISLFNQFSSPTLKSPEYTYGYLCELIKWSKTTICMDADFNNRGYSFLTDGIKTKEINILKNDCKLESKKIVISKNRGKFNEAIFDCLKNNQKIIICSMSSKEAVFYNEIIKKTFPDKKVDLYYSLTDETTKREHFNNIEYFWKQSDCVIYTSTIESGVDFNLEHFYKIFCILQEETISQRSLYQMFNRCRKIEDKTILCLNHTNMTMKSDWFWTIDEVMKSEKILQEFYELKYENGIKKKSLSDFKKVLIWNKVETLNKNKSYFLNYFIQHGAMKGYTFEIEEEAVVKTDKEETTQVLFSKILESEDITYDEYMYLEYLKSSNKNCLSEKQNLQMEKYFYKNLLKVEVLTEEHLKNFYKKHKVVGNYKNLIASKTQNLELVITDKNELLKLRVIIDLIKDLGYTEYTNPESFNFEDFRKNLKKTVEKNFVFTNYKECRVLFCKNRGKNEKDKKNFLEGSNVRYTIRHINSLLNEYGMELKRYYREGKKKENENSLYTLDSLYDLNNIIK